MKKRVTYARVGDNYDTKDPINKISQQAARSTFHNLSSYGFDEVEETRGESAFVWKQGNIYMAFVLECLGTKNLVADAVRKITGKTYYDCIAQDTVATFINDLSTVGAKSLAVSAYWAIQNNSWLEDRKRMLDLIQGWKKACDSAGATWGGGETPTLKGILRPNTVDLAGSVVGIIKNKKRLLSEKKLKSGDAIILINSNGINANGLSLARAVAEKLPQGYATLLSDGTLYGEVILRKSNIYAQCIQNLLDAGIDIHYITNITGHGLRKIMRSTRSLTYVLEKIAEPQELFKFIKMQAKLSDYDMYQTFNMGQDYALFLNKHDVEKALMIIRQCGFYGIKAGYIEKGEKRVIIEPKNITYTSETLNLR